MHVYTSYSIILGALIGQLRKQKAFSQEDVADRLGLTQSAWSRIENGQTHTTVVQLKEITSIFDFRIEKIFSVIEKAEYLLKEDGVKVIRYEGEEQAGTVLSKNILQRTLLELLVNEK